MDVLIRVDCEEPPAGAVFSLREENGAIAPVRFVGWLGLLRALAALLEAGDAPRA